MNYKNSMMIINAIMYSKVKVKNTVMKEKKMKKLMLRIHNNAIRLTVQLSQFIQGVALVLHNWAGHSNFYIRRVRRPCARAFNILYYRLRCNTFDSTYFMGKHVLKFPTDLWVYQEILFERRPDVIVETGVFLGGSTYYFATLQQLMGHGRVIAVDISLDHADPDLQTMPNVTLLEGNTTVPEVVERIRSLIRPGEKVMVVLDSDHATDHVQKEMELFSQLVSDGQYLVVEDGIIKDVYPLFLRNGPARAIKQFLTNHHEFASEYYWNRFLLTHNPGGYLLKNGCSGGGYAIPESNNAIGL